MNLTPKLIIKLVSHEAAHVCLCIRNEDNIQLKMVVAQILLVYRRVITLDSWWINYVYKTFTPDLLN